MKPLPKMTKKQQEVWNVIMEWHTVYGDYIDGFMWISDTKITFTRYAIWGPSAVFRRLFAMGLFVEIPPQFKRDNIKYRIAPDYLPEMPNPQRPDSMTVASLLEYIEHLEAARDYWKAKAERLVMEQKRHG